MSDPEVTDVSPKDEPRVVLDLSQEQAYALAVAAGGFLGQNHLVAVGVLTENVDMEEVERIRDALTQIGARWPEHSLPSIRLTVEALTILTTAFPQGKPAPDPSAPVH